MKAKKKLRGEATARLFFFFFFFLLPLFSHYLVYFFFFHIFYFFFPVSSFLFSSSFCSSPSAFPPPFSGKSCRACEGSVAKGPFTHAKRVKQSGFFPPFQGGFIMCTRGIEKGKKKRGGGGGRLRSLESASALVRVTYLYRSAGKGYVCTKSLLHVNMHSPVEAARC
ncbi:uncharacterized protein LY79DRAFT_38769 [Colletotrichum navitas]|uniref:Uncharacterized protein n=1 Tax=Colletotrichum navitas TaxID=681940 RepID=A0AAD8V084_9PEZI|nr:uncharacterized protein LY79DRAFT_38769 [Colletotrichum navitas]KAK1572969.1 hypothetical protein LY79DRAFT_38769 [Colletotrichum navitas]